MLPTLGVVLGTQSLITILSLAAAGFSGLKWLNKVDTGIEERRDKSIDAFASLKALGLDRFADLAKVYAVGDLGGVAARLKTLFADVNAEGGLMDMLRKSFFKQLESRLNTEDGKRIIELVEAWKAKTLTPPTA